MGKRQYKIKDVHELTGLSRTTISALYNGRATRIDFATIEKLCSLFNCGIDQLLLLETKQMNPSNKLEEYPHE